jgi:hypothetical protein
MGLGPAIHPRPPSDPALSDLLAEVGRVELRDRGEDPLHELARGRVLQGLGDRVKLHAGLAKGGTDRGVVLQVPGEAIELVHHQAVDARVLGETRQHRLELRPVGSPGRPPVARLPSPSKICSRRTSGSPRLLLFSRSILRGRSPQSVPIRSPIGFPPVPARARRGGRPKDAFVEGENVEPMGTQWEPIGECRGAIAEGGPQRRLRPASVEPQTEPILSHGMSGCRIRAVGARHRAFAVPGRIHRVHPIAPTAGVRCASSEPRPPAPSGRRALGLRQARPLS